MFFEVQLKKKSSGLLSIVHRNPSDWLQLIYGKLRLRNIELRVEDVAAIEKEDINFLPLMNSHLFLFELSVETRTTA